MAASMDVEKIEEFVFGRSDSCAADIADEISQKKAKLVQLIEISEPFLTNKNTDIRARGVRLISNVLHLLPKDILNADEVRVLTSFFCDRLKDHHSITPHTLYGLLALSNFTHLPNGTACQILTAIFKEVQVQTLLHIDRRSVFNIISNFLQTQMTELQDKLGSEFVYGFMQVMDGEKDPRNLVILFKLYPIVVKNFPVNLFAEELFEVAACYFPVDFQPRTKEPDPITRDMLSGALIQCLAASPKFAQFCLPLLMEKMTSDLDTAKSDSYKALALCAPVFGPVELSGYLVQIWNAIRLEIFQVFNTSSEHAVLSALRSVVQAFTLSPLSADIALQEFYKKVFEGCSNHLRDSDLQLLQPCSHFLEAIASASPSSCSTILAFVIPLLLEHGKKDLPVTQRSLLLEVLHSFLQICSTTLADATSEPTLAREKQAILEMFTSNLEDSNTRLRVASVRGISAMIVNQGLVENANLSVIADLLALRLMTDSEEDVRCECASCLDKLATLSSDLLRTRVLPTIWSRLNPEIYSDESNKISLHSAWQKIPQLAADGDIGLTICQHLIDQLKLLTVETTAAVDFGVQVAKALVETAKKLLKFPNRHDFIQRSILHGILRWSIAAAELSNQDLQPVFGHEEMLVVGSDIFRFVTADMDEGSASEFSSGIIELFLNGTTSNFQTIFSDLMLSPLKVTSTVKDTRLIIYLQAVVCSVKQKVALPSHDALLPLLLDLALLSPDWFTSTAASKCLAGILNKYNAPVLDSLAQTVKMRTLDQIRHPTDDVTCMKGLNLWIWLTKAFILRGHPLSTEFLNSLMSFLDEPSLSSASAEGLNTILTESSDVLNVRFHGDVKLMYKQRVFQQCMPRIKQGITNGQVDVRPNYLQALSHLLSHIPKQVLMGSLESLLPLFIQSLDQNNPLMYISTLETLQELISEAAEVVAQQVTALIPVFLKLSQYQPIMKVRIAALKCLQCLTQLPNHYVLPYKSEVIQQLSLTLDDKKRLVRKEAVDTRCSWFLLGEA